MILVFGKNGQLARALERTGRVRCLSRDEVDLCNPGTADAAIRRFAPRAVINAAAYTQVDLAEAEEDATFRLNAAAPAEMARACADLGIPFVTVSTDYVFDGSGDTPRRSADPCAPLNAYGRSKRAGEEAVAATGGAWAVLRTSWVFSAHGANFLRTMLRLGAEQGRIRVVDDQIGGPTPAEALAAACLTIAQALTDNPAKSGIYHFAGSPDTSWAGFATEIFNRAGLACTVERISSDTFPRPAVRPHNSRLDCRETETVFGLQRPDWRAAIDTILCELEGER